LASALAKIAVLDVLLIFSDFKASKTPFLNFFCCLALLEWFDLWLFLLRQDFGRFKF
jgi:hypothetical protein